jgi:hypothetical protein
MTEKESETYRQWLRCRWPSSALPASPDWDDVATAFRAGASSATQCDPVPEGEDDFTEWVCPKPVGYLMQCCDCGLIHEVEFRVAKYEPRPSEEFSVVEDPDLQVQMRMRRYEQSLRQVAQPVNTDSVSGSPASTNDGQVNKETPHD